VHPNELEKVSHRSAYIAEREGTIEGINIFHPREQRPDPRTVDESEVAHVENNLRVRFRDVNNLELEVFDVIGSEGLTADLDDRNIVDVLKPDLHFTLS